jgi:prepilin-type N-terminal cleavage/methylation domain-containing protein
MTENAPVSPVPVLRAAPAGFTLIEILVTVVVIAMGCLAALWMQSAAMRGHAQSEHLTAASSLAESEIERLRALSFTDLTKEVDDHGPTGQTRASLNRHGLTHTEGHGPWPYTRTTHYFRHHPTSLSHKVQVIVDWRDAHGSHQVLLTAALTSFSLSPD